ncbi:MAG: hypothetical protein AAF518_11055 [Spirochaetota bacterium]
MNQFIEDSVSTIQKNLAYSLEELSAKKNTEYRKRICQKYTDGQDLYPLWEFINPSFSIREKEAWQWIDEFLQGQETYLLFDKNDSLQVYAIRKEQPIEKFLEEFPWDFYLSNDCCDFLLTQNDHDYLIAAGTAEPWLRQKAVALSQTGWKDMDGRSFHIL